MDATTVGPSCIQGVPAWYQFPSGSPGGTGDEDCLLLNVLAPASANALSNLPVMVEIHGGGTQSGSTDMPLRVV